MNKVIKKIDKYLNEKKGDGEEYEKFFRKMLKKYGVTEPDQLSREEKKKFFKEIEDGWTKEDPKTNDKDES
jgi:hypothetical protein